MMMGEQSVPFEGAFIALSETGLADYVRYSLWGYPIMETLHLFGIVLLFGSIALVDLRLLGFGRKLSLFDIGERHLLRFTWIGFVIILASGLSLFSAYPLENLANRAFQIKMVLIALAGVNMLFFKFRVAHGLTRFSLAEGGQALIEERPPVIARISTGLSFILWISVIACGRLIAYPELFDPAY